MPLPAFLANRHQGRGWLHPLWIAAAVFASFSCQHQKPLPTPSQGSLAFPTLPMPTLTARAPEIRAGSPDMRVDPKWLELDGFFPPGAKRVGPDRRLAVDFAPERRTSFPSTELCSSPDKHFVLFHDGMKRREDIYHWLMILKHDAPFPNAIFLTRNVFDASWSEDSLRFAVTHYIGDNSSEVFIVDTTDLVRKPIDVRQFLEEFFPPHVPGAPLFLKAYRWSRDGRLVVRGIGRSQEPPYELFGCEVVTAFTGPDATPRTSFVRGYVKPQE